MAKTIDILKTLCEPHLEPGEQVVAGVRVNKKGTVKAAAGFGVGGLVGGAIAAAATSKHGQAQAEAGFPDGAQLAFALTDRRVLIFSRGAMSGKPKDYLMSVALTDIVSVELEPAKLVPKLNFVLANGAEVGFEAIKVDKPEEFVAAMKGLSVG